MSLNGKWLCWQVAFPLGVPIVASFLFSLLWKTGNPDFHINVQVVFDVSPWALIFYSMTLIGSTLHEYWIKVVSHKLLLIGMIFTIMSVAIYASFIVIWRQYGNFTPSIDVYAVTGFLLIISVIVCHTSSTQT
jgi:hypothetical protein